MNINAIMLRDMEDAKRREEEEEQTSAFFDYETPWAAILMALAVIIGALATAFAAGVLYESRRAMFDDERATQIYYETLNDVK